MNTIQKLAFGGLLSLALGAHAAVDVNDNLIVNGGAESGVSGWLAFDGYSLFQSVDYGDNWVKPTQPGPVDRGSKMFAGVGERSAGYQTVELGTLAGQPLRYELSGWLGGWLAQQDNALLYVSFLDQTQSEIGYAMIGPMMPGDRGQQTGLFRLADSGVLPMGTTSLMFSLSMERLSGGDNDGYADNLSFVLQAAPVPEPASAWLALTGLGIVGVAAVLRQRRPARG